MHEIGIESSFLEHIRLGRKTVEARLGKPKFLKLKPGDMLRVREDIWEDGGVVRSKLSQVVLDIDQILYFESFQEMFESIDYKSVIPDAASIQDAITAYRTFYSVEDEEEYGVVAIMFNEP